MSHGITFTGIIRNGFSKSIAHIQGGMASCGAMSCGLRPAPVPPQAHHQRPWTITERQFANNVHKVFKPALPFAAACLAASPLLPAWASVFFSTATFFTVMSQQFHAWSHMKGSELPRAVIAAQVGGSISVGKCHSISLPAHCCWTGVSCFHSPAGRRAQAGSAA